MRMICNVPIAIAVVTAHRVQICAVTRQEFHSSAVLVSVTRHQDLFDVVSSGQFLRKKHKKD